MKKKSLHLKHLLYNLISIVILLIMTEAALNTIDYIINLRNKSDLKDNRYLLSLYKGKEWVRDLYKELDEIKGEYKEYRGWGKKEYHGKYINIDSQGVRKTWNPEHYENDPLSMYVFGPSLIWGDGVRDNHTIPSYISKQLNEKGYDFTVSNYGEWSYTFTQGLVYLILLLRDGHRPDYVVFYDGIDVYNAYQSGTPGTLHFAFLFREREKKLTNLQHVLKGVSNIVKENSMIYGEFRKVKARLFPEEARFSEVGHTFDDDQLSILSKGIVEYISSSVSLLDNLSKMYGFQYSFFWPPVLLTEDELLEEEKKLDMRLQDHRLVKLFRTTNSLLKSGTFSHFYNITDAFSGRNKTFYLDFGHTSEEGNEIIAAKILSHIESEYLLQGSRK